MQDKFKQWLLANGKKENTAYSYATSINNISEHYSEKTNQNIDIYKVKDINLLNALSAYYSTSGKYSEFGEKGRGTKRNAIARYAEYFAQNITNGTAECNEIIDDLPENIENQNFSYEKDLQTSLRLQITNLFPNYKIFGNNSEGIEYTIKNRRIDVLLEHIDTKNLLAIELKSGEADFKVFGQISMYLGLLEEKFPQKNVQGMIIAGSIQDSLKQATRITDKVSLKTYRMNIELEEA